MLFVVVVCFAPREVVATMARGVLLPRGLLRKAEIKGRFEVGVLSVATLIAIVALLKVIDLPGSFGAGMAAALLLGAAILAAVKRDELQYARNLSIAAAAGVVVLFGSITLTETRYDYYRFCRRRPPPPAGIRSSAQCL